MGNFEIVLLKSGVRSLRCLERRETYHPVTGPRIEANLLHVDQQRLVERCRSTAEPFVIWDVGFGAAANALASLGALGSAELPDDGPAITLLSFDRSLDAAEFALANAEELGYLGDWTPTLRALLDRGEVAIGPRVKWKLKLADFREVLAAEAPLPAPHAIFYDPYSPATNPDMWTLDHFTRLRARLRDEAPCLLTTYTRSTAVRATLCLAGFQVGVGRAVGEKSETTIATNDVRLLERPLAGDWLARVRVSRNSAPMRDAAAYGQSAMGPEDLRRLELCAQFS